MANPSYKIYPVATVSKRVRGFKNPVAGKVKTRVSGRLSRERLGQKFWVFDKDNEAILALVEQVVARHVGPFIEAVRRAQQETQQVQSSRVDPAVMLTAAQFGTQLGGLSDEAVRQREKSGQLFSVLAEGRLRGRKYPAFQLLPGVADKPLQALLGVLGDLGGALIYQFMTSPNDLLGGLSPLQLLIKEPGGDETATSLLALPDVQRLDSVLNCATDFHAELSA